MFLTIRILFLVGFLTKCKSHNYYLKGVKTCILKVETIEAFLVQSYN